MPILYEKGYLLKITSWENDGDSRKTVDVFADDIEEARMYIEFAKLFKSHHNHNDAIGNMYDEECPVLYPVFFEFCQKFPQFGCGFVIVPDDDDDFDACDFDDENDEKYEFVYAVMDFASKMGLSGGDFYTRVCDKIEIFYFAEPVFYEDVSKEFDLKC